MTSVIHIAALAVFLAASTQAAAADAPSVEGEVAIVSDYRYRGYSLSDDAPALQGGLAVSVPGGLYVGIWGSTIADYGGANVEVDLYAGWAGSVGGMDIDAGVQRYAYPGGDDVDYWEIPISVSRSWTAFTGTLGFAYAPRQDALAEDNRYLYVAGEWAPEHWPVSVNAGLGQEDGAFADGKVDWFAGVDAPWGPVTLSLQYQDSDGPGSGAALVGGLKASF